MSEQLVLLPGYLTAHLQLTLVALLFGTAISVPLGVIVTRMRWMEQPVMGGASVIQTIPSLALLAITRRCSPVRRRCGSATMSMRGWTLSGSIIFPTTRY